MAAESRFVIDMVYTLGAAFLGALAASALRQSVIIGYVLAGIAVGPFTPGFVADRETVQALANVGTIFLLFTLGVSISPSELFKLWRPVVLGGSLQVAAVLALGYGLGLLLNLGPSEAFVLGAALSTSSTAVLGKVLSEANQEASLAGRLAVAWSTIQDLSMVVLAVALTAAFDQPARPADVALSVARAAIFLGLLVPLGAVVLPRVFTKLAELGNKEVFVLAVSALALSAAYVSQFFGISIALGAFVAGIVVAESDLAHVILDHIGPLRDVLAAFFFVSLGMLIEPAFVFSNLGLVLLVLAALVVGKGALIALIALAFRFKPATSITTGVYLAQCAEFSLVLAGLAVEMGAISGFTFMLILSSALLSVAISPLLARLAFRLVPSA